MAPLHRMDAAERRPGACVCGSPHARVGQGEEGEVMQRYQDDGLDDFGWLILMLMALGFLFLALVYVLHWMGWLA